MHLTRPEKFNKNTLSGAILITQEAMFKVQLDCDGKVHFIRLEKSVLSYRQSDPVSYRVRTHTSLTALSWILSRLCLRSSLTI